MTEVVAQLRQAYALVVEAREAATRAEAAIAAGSEIFAEGTRGSIWPQVREIHTLGRAAREDVELALSELGQAQDIIDGYCFAIAGHGIGPPGVDIGSGGSAGARTPGTEEPPPALSDGGDQRDHYPEWIAERERAGAIIDRDNVDRMSKLPDGRTVWVEGKNSEGGSDHILSIDRIGHFERVGIPKHKVMDLLFVALERGVIVGYSGRDRPVYEVTFENERRRIAITVTSKGLIVGAHPISLKRKLRQHAYRS
ncbi:hypothetical protein [Actinoalloteichus hymeniacidonis]|uniref:hypothetical protein n=1 Tax=Actinoalloteichus hymeniacidonis TaxID=340345 RepID=UPI0012FACC67|nr:hypothetical protein [Actinoalloteichus hymeniacidonis]MBB5910772.1 hypothetical protein [Actinoalloteichus hymeniacidonis]